MPAKPCRRDQIINPKTGRCVSRTGKIGQQIVANIYPHRPDPNHWEPTYTTYSLSRNIFTITAQDKNPKSAQLLELIRSELPNEIQYNILHYKIPLVLKSITRQGQKIVIKFKQNDNAFFKLREMSVRQIKTMVQILSNFI